MLTSGSSRIMLPQFRLDYDAYAPTQDAHMLKQSAIFRQIISRVEALPGVKDGGHCGLSSPGGRIANGMYRCRRERRLRRAHYPQPLVYVVTPGFVGAMRHATSWAGISRGTMGQHSEQVVLINASAARIYWPNEDAVGKILTRGQEKDRVVGVVDDVREESVESGGGAQIYYPAMQKQPDWAQLVIGTSVPPASLGPSVLRVLRELNPKQPAAELRRPIRTIVDRANSPPTIFHDACGRFCGGWACCWRLWEFTA